MSMVRAYKLALNSLTINVSPPTCCCIIGTYAIRKDQTGRTLSQIINGSYSILSPIDFWSNSRGWNFFEIVCTKLAEADALGLDQDSILEGAGCLWTVAVILLLMYAFMAEKDFSKSHQRNRQQQEKQKVA